MIKGVLSSTNNGQDWKELNEGLSVSNGQYSVYNFFIDEQNLYVIQSGGIYKLDEVNKIWQLFAALPVLSLAKNGDVLISGVSGSGVYVSLDNGQTWVRNVSTIGVIWDAKSIIVLNNKFYASGNNGVYCSSDNGTTWFNVLNKFTHQLLLKDNLIYAATEEGIKSTSDQGASWIDVGPYNLFFRNVEVYNDKYFGGGDLSIRYFSKELADWVPACRNTPIGQVFSIKIIDDTLYSCAFGGMYRRALSDFDYPELSVPDDIIENYYNKEVGEETYITFAISNIGFDTLKVYDVVSSDPDFELFPTHMDIPPEWGFGINLNYKFTDPGKKTTTITVISSDTTAKNTFTVEVNGLPIDFVLQQNTPNPFNPSTKINYTLPSTAYTSLKVYNSIGELVSVLAEEVQDGGEHTAIFNAGNLSAGIYFYQLQSGSILETKKMVLIK